MKTISRMVRRYICAIFCIVLLVILVNTLLFLGVIIHFTARQQEKGYFPMSEFAESFTETSDGSFLPDTDFDWHSRFVWAMLLGDDGAILWSENLPEELHRPYTIPEVASFSRWYLQDYPVMVYRNDYGLLVAGLPVGSMTRFNFYMNSDILQALLSGFFPLLLLDIGIILFICLILGWCGAKPLRELARGIDMLADGKPVHLKEAGTTSELAEKLNQTSKHLQFQTKLIEQRDTARTNWIAGVSHDIRTPLSLILGYAEQLEHMAPEGSGQQKKAVSIRFQAKKIKTLIEDLNLTSKLQYNAQPLRRTDIQAGRWLRQCVALFYDQLEDRYEIQLSLSEETGQSMLSLDVELMNRALENLLHNSVRHNPNGCQILVRAEIADGIFVLCVHDDGIGYPVEILELLRKPDSRSASDTPHILGLHLVRQIVEAHGGRVEFENDNGAAATLHLKLHGRNSFDCCSTVLICKI